MKKKILLSLSISALALFGCTKGLKPNDPDVYKTKTGIIGVFRQSAFYCENVMPQYITLGAQKVIVKPGWSNEQDNLFISEMKPGIAPLYSYEYSCGEDETKLKLDTTDNGKKPFPYAVKIPDQGFCKIVISFLENDNLFSHNDDLLSEYFEKNEVAAGYPNIPYCDVIDTKGSVVTFMNRDSLYREQYNAAREKAKNLGAEDIQPLVTIGEGSDLASLSGDNTQVVLVTWHNDGERFKDGEITHLKDDEVLWSFTDKEFLKWFRENHDKVDNWDIRLKQLLGKSPDTDNRYFTVFWVRVTDVFRPAFFPEINTDMMNTAFTNTLEEDTSENAMWFKNWFDKTNASAYRKDGFPWTRLGYTYDWGNPDSKYGLSEFIVKEGAEIEVKFTRKNRAFLTWMKDRM
ncbi:hypothetical protein [Fibrobacter sp. UWB10]|uniref:hypothetical protein n=1 Tax=Fibrobacter sp. UWB10 TaxID=1896201 RepID=UPI0024031516|nr:hypothetical protein [Fibrobacter sp. UWB10]SMP41685.1 hypothetical protein SAMN05720465_0665 [Fibrobacter sp. UWB10]